MDSYEKEMKSHVLMGEIGSQSIIGIHLDRVHTPPGKDVWNPPGHRPWGSYEHTDSGLGHVFPADDERAVPSSRVISRVSRTMSSISRTASLSPPSAQRRMPGPRLPASASCWKSRPWTVAAQESERGRVAERVPYASGRVTGPGRGVDDARGLTRALTTGAATARATKTTTASLPRPASSGSLSRPRTTGKRIIRRSSEGKRKSGRKVVAKVPAVQAEVDGDVAMSAVRDAMRAVERACEVWGHAGGEELEEAMGAVYSVEALLVRAEEARGRDAARAEEEARKDLETARQTIAKLRAEVRELKHERSAGGGGAESLRGEVYELSKALASARGEVDELSGQSRGLLGQRDAALVEAGSLRAALALAHSERDALSTELEAMHRVCGISPIGMRGGTTGEDKPWPIAEDKPWGKEQWSPLTPPSSTAESMSGVHRGGSGSAGGGVAGEREEAAELMEWAGSALYDELSATRREKEELASAAQAARAAVDELSDENRILRGQVMELGDGMSSFETARMLMLGSAAECQLQGLHIEGDALLERVARLGRQLHAARMHTRHSSRGKETPWRRTLEDASAMTNQSLARKAWEGRERPPYTRTWITAEEITLAGVMRDQKISPIKLSVGEGSNAESFNSGRFISILGEV